MGFVCGSDKSSFSIVDDFDSFYRNFSILNNVNSFVISSVGIFYNLVNGFVYGRLEVVDG